MIEVIVHCDTPDCPEVVRSSDPSSGLRAAPANGWRKALDQGWQRLGYPARDYCPEHGRAAVGAPPSPEGAVEGQPT